MNLNGFSWLKKIKAPADARAFCRCDCVYLGDMQFRIYRPAYLLQSQLIPEDPFQDLSGVRV